MSAVPPPPPPPPGSVEEKPPPVAWLMPLAAVLAVVGVFTPWFKPQFEISKGSQNASGDAVDDALYSFKEGRLGLIAPVVLVVVGIGVVRLLVGKSSRFHRGSRSPVHSAALGSLGAGAIAAAALLIAYFTLPSFYKFEVEGRKLSWDDAIALIKSQSGADSVDLSQGPQIGFWLTAAAAVVALVGGALMLAMRNKTTPVGAPQGFPPPPVNQPQGYAPPPPVNQPQGYTPPPAQGYAPPPPAQGYAPPSAPPAQGYSAPSLTKASEETAAPVPQAPPAAPVSPADETRVHPTWPPSQ